MFQTVQSGNLSMQIVQLLLGFWSHTLDGHILTRVQIDPLEYHAIVALTDFSYPQSRSDAGALFCRLKLKGAPAIIVPAINVIFGAVCCFLPSGIYNSALSCLKCRDKGVCRR